LACSKTFTIKSNRGKHGQYCSARCRLDAYAIRRAAKLLSVLPIARQMGVLLEIQKGEVAE
jgi:hypothetical protein